MHKNPDGGCLVCIMRHGEAEPYRPNDATRVLTDVGRQQVQTSSHWLTNHYVQNGAFDMALVSPYTRAQQTLDEVMRSCQVARIEQTNLITPEASPPFAADYINALLTQAIQQNDAIKTLLVVSHMPLVSYLVDELCGRQRSQLFATAGIVVLHWREGVNASMVAQFQGV